MTTGTATANHTPNTKDERKGDTKPTDTAQAKPTQAAAPAAVDQDEEDPADRLSAVGKMIRILSKFGKDDRKAIVASLGELTK